MPSINDKYTNRIYQDFSNEQIVKEHKKVTAPTSKLSKIEIRDRVKMLNEISQERGFLLPEVNLGESTLNEKTYEKPDIIIPIKRKVNINYGKVIFGILSIAGGLALLHTEMRLRFILLGIGVTLLINGLNDPDY